MQLNCVQFNLWVSLEPEDNLEM